MDQAAQERFKDVYSKHAATVYRYCLFRTNSPDEAEDVTAEVFAQLVKDEDKLYSDHLVAWLLRVAANRCVDEARRAQRDRRSRAATRAPIPGIGNGWRDEGAWAAVSQLNDLQQEVIYLRIVEDLSFAQVAKLIGRSEPATKMIFYRGTKKLSRMLGRRREDANTV